MIAVVDDHKSVRNSLKALLRSAGYAVETFESAEAFLDSGITPETRCLILDVQIPGMGGLRLQARLNEDHAHVPIIFISAQEDSSLREQMIRDGAISLLHKPFPPNALLSTVQEALGSARKIGGKAHGAGVALDGCAFDDPILARLKHETRPLHCEIESRMDLFNRVRALESYRHLLECLYGLYRPLETELRCSRPEIIDWLPQFDRRLRLASLRSDLGVVGNLLVRDLPSAPIPSLASMSRKFGCLYVLEGSTLGGQVISRHIEAQLGYTPAHGCAFFAGYGQETGSMWHQFRSALNSFAAAHNAIDQEEIIDSAKATFTAFSSWIQRTL